jgi:sulfite exporter TauE/SafE
MFCFVKLHVLGALSTANVKTIEYPNSLSRGGLLQRICELLYAMQTSSLLLQNSAQQFELTGALNTLFGFETNMTMMVTTTIKNAIMPMLQNFQCVFLSMRLPQIFFVRMG